MKDILQIDIDKILQDKSPSLKKWLPNFLVNWFKKFIHQEEMNYVLREGNHLKGVEFAKFTIDYMGSIVEYRGLENIPLSGGCIVAANHPLGGARSGQCELLPHRANRALHVSFCIRHPYIYWGDYVGTQN